MAGIMWSAHEFGQLLSLQTFGESHGSAIGGVLSGLPSGVPVFPEAVQAAMERRRPGRSAWSSPRQEMDEVELLSGIFEGKTTGSPIGFLIKNRDQRSGDYDGLKEVWRPSHADYTYGAKYGHRDHRGGGRSSARETACRVAAGALVMPWLNGLGMEVKAWVSSIHCLDIPDQSASYSLEEIRKSPLFCPDAETEAHMKGAIAAAKAAGDSLGGIVTCELLGVPAGLGEPMYYKLHAALGASMLSIHAVKAFEMGEGFGLCRKKGSEANDSFVMEGGKVVTSSNHSAGVQGGISNGMPIRFRVGFKPTATISKAQRTLDRDGKAVVLEAQGRHDPCVVPRAVPVVEAMAALVIGDMWLLQQSRK